MFQYSFRGEPDLPRIIREAAERPEGAPEVIVVTIGGADPNWVRGALLMISDKFLARFWGDEDLVVVDQVLGSAWGGSSAKAMPESGGYGFEGMGYFMPGYSIKILAQADLGAAKQAIEAARKWKRAGKINVHYW